MAYYSDDIRRIADVRKNKTGLDDAIARGDIFGNTKAMQDVDPEISSGLTPPLTVEILTYDDSQDVEVSTPTGTATIKTAETAKIIDASGNEWPIDTIIYAVP